MEVTEGSLERIERLDGEINAFCLVDAERALTEARASQERWARGEPAGPLDGVPVAVKDLLLTRGWPTLRGSRAVDPAGPWEGRCAGRGALRRSGAVMPGKTTTPELGWKGVTDSALEGVTRNPWDTSRTAGGSSGGSSAALSAGMVPLALGSDGGGSIRIPCGFCGLAGIKPTFGRVPAWPASPFGPVSHVGPMARTVTDAALLLDVMSEPDARDWIALPPPRTSFTAGIDDGVAGLRIAFSPALGYAVVEPEVAALVSRAALAFGELGAHVEMVDPGFDDRVRRSTSCGAPAPPARVADLGDPEGIDPGLVEVAEAGRGHTAVEYIAALQARDRLAMRMSLFHQDWDLLLTPTLPLVAFEAGREIPEGATDPRWPGWTPFSYPFNMTQQPAATVPCGFTDAGLPAGLQIVGPRYAEALVLRAARAYEAAHPQPTVAGE